MKKMSKINALKTLDFLRKPPANASFEKKIFFKYLVLDI